MKTIQTKPDCTLGFWDIRLKQLPGRMVGDCYRGKWVPMDISEGLLLSEITEEQARELVEKISSPLTGYIVPSDPDKISVCIGSANSALNMWAQSVGIEEKDFDKYLVIKL